MNIVNEPGQRGTQMRQSPFEGARTRPLAQM
jgi:hypothetical protein